MPQSQHVHEHTGDVGPESVGIPGHSQHKGDSRAEEKRQEKKKYKVHVSFENKQRGLLSRKPVLFILFFQRQGQAVHGQEGKNPHTVNHIAADHHHRVLRQRPEIHLMAIQPGGIGKTVVSEQKHDRQPFNRKGILFCKRQFIFHLVNNFSFYIR